MLFREIIATKSPGKYEAADNTLVSPYSTNLGTLSALDSAVDLIDASHIRTIEDCLSIPEGKSSRKRL